MIWCRLDPKDELVFQRMRYFITCKHDMRVLQKLPGRTDININNPEEIIIKSLAQQTSSSDTKYLHVFKRHNFSFKYLHPDHVSQSMVFFVDGKDGCIGHFCILFDGYSVSKDEKGVSIAQFETLNTHFVSPSNTKKDSKACGAFMLMSWTSCQVRREMKGNENRHMNQKQNENTSLWR